eukprot:6546333-Ditylum_brightwellii.AAC.1
MVAALHVHFPGKSQKESIVDQTMKANDGVFYRSHGTYTFPQFTTNLEETFTTFDDYTKPVSE